MESYIFGNYPLKNSKLNKFINKQKPKRATFKTRVLKKALKKIINTIYKRFHKVYENVKCNTRLALVLIAVISLLGEKTRNGRQFCSKN